MAGRQPLQSKTGSVEGEWNKFRKTSLHGYADGVDVLMCLDFIEQGNTGIVTAAIDRSGAGMSGRIMREAVIERILFKVVRAFGKSVRSDDHHTRVGIDFLRRPGVLVEETDLEKRALLESAVKEFDRLAVDPRLVQIGHYRDKSLAHIGVHDEGKPPPIAKDLFDFSRETSALWGVIRKGADIHTLPMEFHLEQYRQSTSAFWAPWRDDEAGADPRSK